MFRPISRRFLKIPKGQGATGKPPGKQEMDAEFKAMTSLMEAMECSKLTKGEVSTEESHSQLLDGEHCHGERLAIILKWRNDRG